MSANRHVLCGLKGGMVYWKFIERRGEYDAWYFDASYWGLSRRKCPSVRVVPLSVAHGRSGTRRCVVAGDPGIAVPTERASLFNACHGLCPRLMVGSQSVRISSTEGAWDVMNSALQWGALCWRRPACSASWGVLLLAAFSPANVGVPISIVSPQYLSPTERRDTTGRTKALPAHDATR